MLYFSTTPDLTMRAAFQEELRELFGPPVVPILRMILDTRSSENLERLYDMYPGHVIEFSVFKRPVGILGWNTIFWEVKRY